MSINNFTIIYDNEIINKNLNQLNFLLNRVNFSRKEWMIKAEEKEFVLLDTNAFSSALPLIDSSQFWSALGGIILFDVSLLSLS